MSTVYEDEKGNKWAVFEGDPAYHTVHSLEKKGYRWIVLPVDFYTGVRSTPDENEVEGWWLDGIHELEMSDEMEDAQMKKAFYLEGLRFVQLAECIKSAEA